MSRPALNNEAEEAADLPNAVFRPPLGPTRHAPSRPPSGITGLFIALSDSPKQRDLRQCICRNETLTVGQARYLADHADRVTLTNLIVLNAQVARELAACSYLECPSLTFIYPDTARELANVGAALKLPGLTSLDAVSAQFLATQRGHLGLGGLVELEPGVAAVLASHFGSLNLDGLRIVSADELKQLTKHIGPVNLASLPPDTPGLAEAFAGFRYPTNVIFSTKSAPQPSER